MQEIQVEETGTKYRRGQPIEAEKAEGALCRMRHSRVTREDFRERKWRRKEGGGKDSQISIMSQWPLPLFAKNNTTQRRLRVPLQRNGYIRRLCVCSYAARLYPITASWFLHWIQLRVNFIRLAAGKSVYCGLFSLCYPPFLLILLLV